MMRKKSILTVSMTLFAVLALILAGCGGAEVIMGEAAMEEVLVTGEALIDRLPLMII